MSGIDERPDYKYWVSKRRPRLSNYEMEVIEEELGTYSQLRFPLGRRFRLLKSYAGIPRGTRCTVTSSWPNTQVRWDKWGQGGIGSLRLKTNLNFELDLVLEPVDEEE